MAQRIETITQHVFAFDDDEITTILNALYEADHDELANEIWDELPGEREACECDQDESRAVEDLIDVINKFNEGR